MHEFLASENDNREKEAKGKADTADRDCSGPVVTPLAQHVFTKKIPTSFVPTLMSRNPDPLYTEGREDYRALDEILPETYNYRTGTSGHFLLRSFESKPQSLRL